LRIKRKKQTIFLHVEPSDSFGAIKKQLSEILEMEPTNIGLHAAPDKVGAHAQPWVDPLQLISPIDSG
jgi:hypothetical protein